MDDSAPNEDVTDDVVRGCFGSILLFVSVVSCLVFSIVLIF